MSLEKAATRFERASLALEKSPYEKTGVHAEALLAKDELRRAVNILYEEKFYLVFVTAVSMTPAACVVYQFAHHESPGRINLRIFAHDNEAPTISHIFQGANWYEREVHDFFGITFGGHPDMRPLILSELDMGSHPLLKKEEAMLSAETLGFLPPKPAEEEGENLPKEGSPVEP